MAVAKKTKATTPATKVKKVPAAIFDATVKADTIFVFCRYCREHETFTGIDAMKKAINRIEVDMEDGAHRADDYTIIVGKKAELKTSKIEADISF